MTPEPSFLYSSRSLWYPQGVVSRLRDRAHSTVRAGQLGAVASGQLEPGYPVMVAAKEGRTRHNRASSTRSSRRSRSGILRSSSAVSPGRNRDPGLPEVPERMTEASAAPGHLLSKLEPLDRSQPAAGARADAISPSESPTSPPSISR